LTKLDKLEGRVGRIAAIVDEMKGEHITVLDLREVCNFADAFVIATARSAIHMRSIIGRVMETLREEGLRPIGKPDKGDERWSVVDYGDVVVHIFNPEARLYYDLENLWGDAEEMPWRELVV
jgi:ribosome-associated protein